ncbi:MAG: glutaredoxin family protein [Alcanivorax sp.]|jgi:hypothetical protein|nr:glutaredoxin family protein [Pseudomonas sp.]PHR18900.1 MAG: thioredoxin family protein [Sphingopyxis sp.]
MSFVLLGTEGCHLCEDATAILVAAAQGLDITVYQDDIAVSEDLVTRYGVRIPVLKNETSGAELDWPFSFDEVREFIQPSVVTTRLATTVTTEKQT